MRLRTLNALLAPAGVAPFSYRGSAWEQITPTTITQEGDRGERHVETFRDEDELCRHLLVRSLVGAAPRPRARRHEPAMPALATVGVDAPDLRWRSGLPPLSRVVGRGRGLVVVRDTTGLVVDPRRGAAQVTIVDVGSGQAVSSWLPAHGIDRALVLGTTEQPVVVLHDGERTEAFSVGGDPLWSTSRRRWGPTIDAGTTVVLQESSHLADGMVVVGGDAVAVDVRTGEPRWEREALSRPDFAFAGAPWLDRFFAWDVRAGHLDVLRVDLATGDTRVMAGGELPDAYAGTGLTVLEDLMDADCRTGHLTIRASASPRRGEVGTRLGDLLVVAGDPVLRVLTEAPAAMAARAHGDLLASSFVPGRLVVGDDEVSCTDLDAQPIWTRPGRGIIRARAGEVVLMETRGVVEAIADDGTTRWERPGALWVVAHDAVWLSDGATVSVVDPATGDVRWAGPAPWSSAGGPGLLHGASHADDARVLVEDGVTLQAFGPA